MSQDIKATNMGYFGKLEKTPNFGAYSFVGLIEKIGFGITWFYIFLHFATGCPTKHDPHSFCLIFLATNMLKSWGIIHWKGVIYSFVWSTKTFPYNIRVPRYKQI